MKKQDGISLIMLVIIMIVMVILIGIVGTYSLENINKSKNAVSKMEFSNVRDFALKVKTKIEMDDYEYDTHDLVLANDLLYAMVDDKLTRTQQNDIVEVNGADIPSECKYLYIPASEKLFEDMKFTEDNITIQDVKNDYIINFYTGTIICVLENSCEVDGLIKGIGEINNLLGY